MNYIKYVIYKWIFVPENPWKQAYILGFCLILLFDNQSLN